MENSNSSRQPGFSEELSQLVKKHISNGADPADIADALSLQAEVANTQSRGTAEDDTTSHSSEPYSYSTTNEGGI